MPEWFMHTTDAFGGLTLGAFAGARLVGYSYALPGFDGEPFLLSCGLVVAAGFESRGIGASLKLAQAEHARRAGYRRARWTTNALASRPLRLYLSRLGARLVRYRPGMYAEVQDALLPDEVEIEWDLAPAGEAGAAGGERRSVEIPWDRRALERSDPRLAVEWMGSVRASMEELLASGWVGTAVDLDPPRSFVRFERS